MGISTENTDKKSTPTSQNYKTVGDRWNMLGRKGKKKNTSKTTNAVQGNKPEGSS